MPKGKQIPTKTRKKTVRKARKIDLNISVRWNGHYFENRDALEAAFPRQFSGSGHCLFNDSCDAQFQTTPKTLEKMLNRLDEVCVQLEKTNNFRNSEISVYWYFASPSR